jgi:hypothetical protein
MKTIRIIVFLLLCTTAAWAQPRLRTPEFWLGFHGGVSASTIAFRPGVANMKPITNACVLGGNGGFVFRYAGHKYCHFQMELNYVHRGWAEKNAAGEHYSRNLHYIELPILMHLHFGSEICQWFFNLGPQIGYCVYDENKSIEKPFDWGLLAGTGVLFNTKKAGTYQLEVRVDYSFGGIVGTSVLDKYNMASPLDLSINLGWLMPIKSRKSKVESQILKGLEIRN